MTKSNNNYICKIADIEEINTKWDYEINNHPHDNSWVVWKKKFIDSVKAGKRICYYGILNGQIISEATAVIAKGDIQNSEGLIDDHMAYLNAFRTITEYQGQGYFSKLYKFMEIDLKNRGFTKLTLGVEPSEVKNMQIYFNWGYINFVKMDYEKYPKDNDHSKSERIIVNYYSKNI